MVKAFLVVLSLLFLSFPVSAIPEKVDVKTTYDFTVDEEIATCEINEDGSAWISYTIKFTNRATIDYVDIGMPNRHYDLSTATATLLSPSTVPLSGIKKSSAIPCGYEIPIPSMYQKSQFIQITTKCKVTRMVYPNTENSNYASVEFYPTWWGSFCKDICHLQTTIIFPPKVTDPNSTKWHHQKPDWMRIEDGRIKFTWNSSGNYEHRYGVSFPRTAVTNVFEPEQSNPWQDSEENFQDWFTIYVPYFCCTGFPLILIVVVIAACVISSWRSKMQYLPPSVGVEGMGIKYGLTAPEAAVVLNVPLNKIVNMVYFGMYKKGIISVESWEPVKLKVLRTDYEGLHSYEVGFRAAIRPDGSVDEEIIKSATIQLIKDVDTKMRGFSRKETANYYRQIIKKAWEQVKAAKMDDEKLKILEDKFEWMYLDSKFNWELKRNFGKGSYRAPYWYPFFYPRVVYVHPATATKGTSPSFTPSLPVLPGSNFANQIVSGLQNSANQFVKNLTSFTQGVSAATNPTSVSTGASVRTGSFGGGGCACACACAGCACACAGGGR